MSRSIINKHKQIMKNIVFVRMYALKLLFPVIISMGLVIGILLYKKMNKSISRKLIMTPNTKSKYNIPKGFANTSNYCYFNASLQCLLSSDSFVDMVVTSKNMESLYAFKIFLREIMYCNAKHVSTDILRSNLSAFVIKNNLQCNLISIPTGSNIEQNDAKMMLDFMLTLAEFSSISIKNLWATELTNTFTCPKSHKTSSLETTNIIYVDCVDQPLETLLQATEKIQEFTCTECQVKYTNNEVEKNTRITVAKKCLFLCIQIIKMKFAYNKIVYCKDKYTTPIPTSINILNSVYKLKSIVTHIGATVEKGHYLSYVFKNNNWYKCNDINVSLEHLVDNKISFKKHIETPYLLLYEN